MRKYYFFGLAVFLYFTGHSQQVMQKITQKYFRSNPFISEFGSFVRHLVNDPTLKDKVQEKKTDTSFYYFQGTYAGHNPFFFKPTRVEVILSQSPIYYDSLNADTVFNYQLLAYANYSKEAMSELKKEFEKLVKRFKTSFYKTTLIENPPTSSYNGATYNFFDARHGVAPLAVTWAGPTGTNEICLILTVRMSVHENRAILPVPLYALEGM